MYYICNIYTYINAYSLVLHILIAKTNDNTYYLFTDGLINMFLSFAYVIFF